MNFTKEELLKEFDRQLDNLISKNYPKLTNLSESEFRERIEKIRDRLPEELDTKSSIPFVIVVTNKLVKPEESMQEVEVSKTKGHVNMDPTGSEAFQTIKELEIPDKDIYLMLDVDTGQETLNVRPYDAMIQIRAQNRHPITIDEGVAIVTHYPEVLKDKEKYNCFSMLGSRGTDKRVPAMWISYKKPRLGWCWEKNPHTWLGSASCKSRI